MRHTRRKPYHPMTQGKIERRHLSLKSRILLENYYLPGDLERAVASFLDHYNRRRYHESLENLTPADLYLGHGARILKQREKIKRRTSRDAHSTSTQQHEIQADAPHSLLVQPLNCPKYPADGHACHDLSTCELELAA